MSTAVLIFASADRGLLDHWQHAQLLSSAMVVKDFSSLQNVAGLAGSMVWLDHSLPGLPALTDVCWPTLAARCRVVFATTYPKQDEAVLALDKGCAAYTQAYADAETLRQIQQVVTAGHVWVGRDLMQTLLSSVQRVATQLVPASSNWAVNLTEREVEVARLAANGAANGDIAAQCGITERTVKAHLSAVFAKLQLTDRLQLALRVHGIR